MKKKNNKIYKSFSVGLTASQTQTQTNSLYALMDNFMFVFILYASHRAISVCVCSPLRYQHFTSQPMIRNSMEGDEQQNFRTWKVSRAADHFPWRKNFSLCFPWVVNKRIQKKWTSRSMTSPTSQTGSVVCGYWWVNIAAATASQLFRIETILLLFVLRLNNVTSSFSESPNARTLPRSSNKKWMCFMFFGLHLIYSNPGPWCKARTNS